MGNCGCEQVGTMLFQMRLILAQAFDFSRQNQIPIIAKRQAVLGRELLSSLGNEIDMRAVTQDFSSSPDGIRQALYTSDSPRAKSGPIHNQGIELDLSIAVQETAAAGVEGFVIFHDNDRFLDGIERRATAGQCFPPGSNRPLDTVKVGINHAIGYGPGAAMHHKNRRMVQGIHHIEERPDSLAFVLEVLACGIWQLALSQHVCWSLGGQEGK
jgi:hypothetical protein